MKSIELCRIINLNQLKQLHANLIHYSLHHHHNYWLSLLIAHCKRLHAPPSYVRLIFYSSPRPNIHVFASMFKYYSQLASTNDVILLFKNLIRNGDVLKSDGLLAYPLVIKGAKEYGIMFHAHVVKLGIGNHCYSRNALLDVYAKYWSVGLARKLFDEMSERSVVDWNAMISGYWKVGNRVEACCLFNDMSDNERNVVTWTTMVTGFSRIKDLDSARKYFDDMPTKTVVSWNAMLSGYVQNGFLKEGFRLFEDMMKVGVNPNDTTWVAVISLCSLSGDSHRHLCDSVLEMMDRRRMRLNSFVLTALIDMYANCRGVESAREYFDELGTRKSIATWNAMISAYTRSGHLDLARELFNKIPAKDVVTWNSMITGHAQNGEPMMAINFFKDMVASGDSEPDEVTVSSVLSACGHLGALDIGRGVVDRISQYGISLTSSGYNALIFMYSKCGSVRDARRVFHEMEVRDLVTYNTLISEFAAHGDGNGALKLLSDMIGDSIEPDRVTYIGILTACSHSGLVEEGKNVFELIKNPDLDHYACMVDLFGRVGKLNEAMGLIKDMPMEPHAGVYGSLLNASKIYKNIELGEFAANKLFDLEPLSSGNYVLLSNIYASVGRWNDVDRIRQMMRSRGIMKATGWSWVEYKGGVHKFIAGDTSHERSNDIYRRLEELRGRMKRHGYMADKSCVLRDVEEEEQEDMVGTHSEKLAICFALLVSEAGEVIRVVKNLRVCADCHTAIKMISKVEGREIIVRDNRRFHHFIDGFCSCKDYW